MMGDSFSSIIQNNDSSFVMAGSKQTDGPSNRDFWLVKIDEMGDIIWSQTYGGRGTNNCSSVIRADGGGYIMLGGTDSFGAGAYDFWLIRTDENGDSLWSKTLGGEESDSGKRSFKPTTGVMQLLDKQDHSVLVGRTFG